MNNGGQKKILIIANAGGFLNKFEIDNVKMLQGMGYEVHYAANENEQYYPPNQKEIEKLGVIFHHIDIARSPYMFRYNWRALKELVRIIREEEIQLVHCHTPVGGMLGRLAACRSKRKNMKVIYTAHGFHFYKGAPLLNNTIYYLAEKVMAPYTDVLVVINQEDYQSAKKLRLKKNGMVYKIPGVGIHMEKFKPLPEEEKRKMRNKLSLKEEDFFLVSVGELNQNKNQLTVLRAIAKLKQENPKFPIKYGICGEGFYTDRVKEAIRDLHLEDVVCLYGYRNNVTKILGCADGSIFPSIREGLGMAGLESLSMGIPVLASDNRGTREYMKDGENGYIFPPMDEERMMQCIYQLYHLSDLERKKMIQCCIESVKPFAYEHTKVIMEQIYQSIDQKVR